MPLIVHKPTDQKDAGNQRPDDGGHCTGYPILLLLFITEISGLQQLLVRTSDTPVIDKEKYSYGYNGQQNHYPIRGSVLPKS
jgi:hypothetical protein